VVKSQLATVHIALACIKLPLGAHQLSVSILKLKSTDGLDTFSKPSFIELALTQLPINLKATLVLETTSHRFCSNGI
jgi:hypothetical protein